MDQGQEIHDRAVAYAKAHKEEIAREVTSRDRFVVDKQPISVFMAGSPGAGKTEFSKNLISILEEDKIRQVVRIDADEYRNRFTEYDGKNSFLFHGAVSLIVEKVHDYALHNSQSFILDGTFARPAKAVANIQRSLDKKRGVIIFYLFQIPEVAWKFTQDREKIEGRNITKEMFIDGFFGALDSVREVVKVFGPAISVFFVRKDYIRNEVADITLLNTGDNSIDKLLPQGYTKESLEKSL